MLRLPRAPGGVGQVVLDPKVYNDMADAIERFDALSDQIQQALNITVAPPLQISRNRNGIRISLADRLGIARVIFGSSRAGFGEYAGTLGRFGGDAISTSTDYDASDNTISLSLDITIVNLAESQIATHRVGPGTVYFAWATGAADDAGRPVYETLYNHAVRFTRWNATTHTWQETYHDAATAADVADEFWVDVQEFIACPTP